MELLHLTQTNTLIFFQLTILLLLSGRRISTIEGNNPKLARWQRHTIIRNRSLSSSRLLNKVISPREIGCWKRPWICKQPGQFLPRMRMRCCRNRCVDVSSDPENCGLCGIRCPFTWQCCRDFCINTNLNPFHCGRCEHRCRFPSFCLYGICNYAQPLPPFPFPPRPPFPFPFPPKPPKPHSPKPFQSRKSRPPAAHHHPQL